MNNNSENKKILPEALTVILTFAMLIYLTVFCVVPLTSIPGILILAGFACSYSVILSKGYVIYAILIPAVSAISAVVYSAAGEGLTLYTALQYTNLLAAVASGYVLYICAKRNIKKSSTFAAISTVMSIYICGILLFIIATVFGKIDIETIKLAINKAGDFLENTYKVLLQTAASSIAPDGSLDKTVKTLADSFSTSVILSLPSTIVIYGMGISALVTLLYKPAVKIYHAENTCLNERNWIFDVSTVSAVVFEIVFLGYVFSIIFSGNLTFAIAFTNLMSVLSVPFAYLGLKHFFLSLKNKTQSAFAGILILFAAFMLCSFLIGASTFIMVCAFFGASNTMRKNTPKGLE